MADERVLRSLIVRMFVVGQIQRQAEGRHSEASLSLELALIELTRVVEAFAGLHRVVCFVADAAAARIVTGLAVRLRECRGTLAHHARLDDFEARILPARIADYHPRMLDELGAAGELAWIGAGALGTKDGRIVLVRRDRAPWL